MQPYGYVFLEKARSNSIYVKKEKEEYFRNKKAEGEKWLKSKELVPFLSFRKVLAKELKYNIQDLYNSETDDIFYYFSNLKPIYIEEISKRSNFLGENNNKTDRPIFVFEFNPHRVPIYVNDPQYTVSQVTIAKKEFYKLTLLNERQKTIDVYILNHFFQPEIEPKIIVVSKTDNIPLNFS